MQSHHAIVGRATSAMDGGQMNENDIARLVRTDITATGVCAAKVSAKDASTQRTPCPNALGSTNTRLVPFSPHHRMVICLAIWLPLLPTPPSRDAEALTPALRSNTFQNLRLSSAARHGQCEHLVRNERCNEREESPAVASICPSGLRQLCNTRVSWAGISTFRTSVG
jgi:hypothetical protein